MKIVQRRQGNNIKDLWIVRFDSPLQSMRWLTLPYQRLFFQEYGYSKDTEFPGGMQSSFESFCFNSAVKFPGSLSGRRVPVVGTKHFLWTSWKAARWQLDAKKTPLLTWDWDDTLGKFWLSKLKAEFSICK